jgi:hypothetical protein
LSYDIKDLQSFKIHSHFHQSNPSLNRILSSFAKGIIKNQYVSDAILTGGAIGAVVGEIAGDLYREEMEKQGRFNPSTSDFEKIQERGVDIARFTAAAIATLLNQDAEAAALTAGNAARYNALAVVPVLLGAATVGCVISDAREIYETYVEDGVEAAARKIGFVVVLAATGVYAGKVVYKLGKIVAPTAIEAIKLYKKANPEFAKLYDKAAKAITKKAETLKNSRLGQQLTQAVETVEKEVSSVSKKKAHKNAKSYVGDTHVYSIQKVSDGKTHKVGQSAQGYRKKDGASKRAEQQARRLQRKTGEYYTTKVRKKFPNKKDALEYETKLIKRTRKIKGKDALQGNKNDR